MPIFNRHLAREIMKSCRNNPDCCTGGIVILMITAAAVIIYYGFCCIEPYRYSLDFQESLCTAINVTDHGSRECDCGGDEENECTSLYPCEEIKVVYFPDGTPTTHHTSLFEGYKPLKSGRKCATAPCSRSIHENEVTVAKFVKKYGNVNSTSQFQCLYNPINWDEVIMEHQPVISVILAMLLPSLVIVVGAIILFALHCSPQGGYMGMFRKSSNNYVV